MTRAQLARAASDLPLVADLVAAALRAGAPLGSALVAVGTALGGELGDRCVRAGRGLVLGATAEDAWSALDDLPLAAPLVRAAVRASESGAALAGSLERLAADLRSEAHSRAEEVAARAGVFAVLPLGLCFLPAFVLVGIVPVVAAVIGGLR